jgi:hypothetical protein
MSPRAVDKRARPGNDHQPARPAPPESPTSVTTLQPAEENPNRISQHKRAS